MTRRRQECGYQSTDEPASWKRMQSSAKNGRQCEEYLRNNVIIRLMYYKLGLVDEGNRRLEQKFPCAYLELLENSIPNEHNKEMYLRALTNLIAGYLRILDEVVESYKIRDLKRMDKEYFIGAIERLRLL